MSRKNTTLNNVFLFICFTCLLCKVYATVPFSTNIKNVITSTLGLGPQCSGCPARYCDDDPSIIHGYCCGCRRMFDNLPVNCSPLMRCPLNTYELCQQYEYMLYCCCQK